MTRAMIWLGGLALLAATLFDTVSVLGRNFGFPLHGVIELIQAAVLVAGGIALVLATLHGTHAKVHILVDRFSPERKAMTERVSALVVAAFFGAMLAGSAWLSADLWNSNELSELIGVPWHWLRLFANLCLLGAVVVLLQQAVRGKR